MTQDPPVEQEDAFRLRPSPSSRSLKATHLEINHTFVFNNFQCVRFHSLVPSRFFHCVRNRSCCIAAAAAALETAGTALTAGLGTADLTVRGLAERASGLSSAQRTTAVDVSDAVRRGSTYVQPGTIPLRLALDPQDLSERHRIHRERLVDSEQTHTDLDLLYSAGALSASFFVC